MFLVQPQVREKRLTPSKQRITLLPSSYLAEDNRLDAQHAQHVERMFHPTYTSRRLHRLFQALGTVSFPVAHGSSDKSHELCQETLQLAVQECQRGQEHVEQRSYPSNYEDHDRHFVWWA